MLTVRRLLVAITLFPFTAPAVPAQGSAQSAPAVIAVADSLLAALSRNDMAALARLVTDSATVGSSAMRGGTERLSIRSWASDMARTFPQRITERGFDATAHVQDRVAHVWMPYDLYLDGRWSHCGVDAFTLVKTNEQWKVAALLYTVEQPPACRKHPAGPPAP